MSPLVFFCDECGYALDRDAFDEYYEHERNVCNRCKADRDGELDELEVRQDNDLDDEDEEPEDDWDEDWIDYEDEDEEEDE